MKTKPYVLLIAVVFSTVLLAGSNFSANAQSIGERDVYSTVKIYLNSPGDVGILQANDIDIEHYRGNIKDGIILVLSEEELANLKSAGMRYDIVISDMREYHMNREEPTADEMQLSRSIQQNDNVNSFSYGSMGGFYTYAEIVEKLDSMRLLHPTLISQKKLLGTTHENRQIWAVKISDNPDVNESSSESQVYYDALHHAREPMAMAVLMYYMYWLLENYGTNPEATYLVNNREIFFVPIVNPDGYVYNQTTDPNGGGFWRKNRRNNSGSFGVDLNRNYAYGWGQNNGSSSNPSSNIYRGPSAFSEPESQAVRDFLLTINPSIGFSVHSVAGRYLNPYGYTDTAINFEVYADFSSEFAASNGYLYGTAKEMLDYYSSGTTRDYLHAQGTFAWTPEIGGSGFWPMISEIIPLVSENLTPLKYLAWVSGAYSKMQNFSVVGNGYVVPNDTLSLKVDIRNKGLTRTANNVSVEITTSYPHITPIVASLNYGNITTGAISSNASPFRFSLSSSASLGDEIKLVCVVKQEGVEASRDTLPVYVGAANVLFSDNAENGISNWTGSGTGSLTDTTFISSWDGSKSFADSRYGNSLDNGNNYFTLNNTINLSGTVRPRIEFAAKWATEEGADYSRIQVSSNGGSSWTSMTGKHTSIVSGRPSYTGLKYWVREQINLNAYIGQSIKIRFNHRTDPGLAGDGFYFDDFRVVDYRDGMTSITPLSGLTPDKFDLLQNYPNPFNPSTEIRFDIPQTSEVRLKVYDGIGREVSTLINEQLSTGRYSVNWNAASLPSGVYIYRLEAGEFVSIKKMLLVK